jgi:hypothetical protein
MKGTESVPICITGMHRSGTSMVARLLNLCGLSLGRESDLLNPGPDNPEGFWENVRFVKINEALLAEFGGAWDVPPVLPGNWAQDPRLLPLCAQASELTQGFANYAHWGWKDPRTSLTLTFWQELLPDLRVIICLRNPSEVADSLYRRGYNSATFTFQLWQTYYERLLAATPLEKRLITHHDAYFSQPEAELGRVLYWLGWSVPNELVTRACTTIRVPERNTRVTHPEPVQVSDSNGMLSLYAQLCAEAGPIFQQTRQEQAASSSEPSAPPTTMSAPLTNGYSPGEVDRQEREIYVLEQEQSRLRGMLVEQGRWARELEAIAREQQATIRAYQRALGPVLPFARAVRALKARFTRHS